MRQDVLTVNPKRNYTRRPVEPYDTQEYWKVKYSIDFPEYAELYHKPSNIAWQDWYNAQPKVVDAITPDYVRTCQGTRRPVFLSPNEAYNYKQSVREGEYNDRVVELRRANQIRVISGHWYSSVQMINFLLSA